MATVPVLNDLSAPRVSGFLDSSINPATVGQPVTFRYSFAQAQYVPGGGPTSETITFRDGLTTPGTIDVSRSPSDSFTTSSLSTGDHAITAIDTKVFADSSVERIISPVLTQTVKADSSLEYHLTTSTSVYGQSVGFQVDVHGGTPADPSPTGLVTIYATPLTTGIQAPLAAIATRPVQGSSVLFTTSRLPVGDYTIRVSYSGDSHFNASTNPDYLQTLQVARASSSIVSVSAPQTTYTYGQTATLSVTVGVNTPSTAAPTGTLTFYDGATVLGSTPYLGAATTFTTPRLATGNHAITVGYSGDDDVAGTNSAVIAQTVVAASTYTVLTTSAPIAALGSTITYAATVAPFGPGSGIPTGSVAFYDGSTLLGSIPLANARAALSVPAGNPGRLHSIHAVYTGDPNFVANQSATLIESIVRRVTPKLSAFAQVAGDGVRFVANLIPATTGGPTPTGMVTLLADGKAVASRKLSEGSVGYLVNPAVALNKTFSLRYGGDANDIPTRSSLIVINKSTRITPQWISLTG